MKVSEIIPPGSEITLPIGTDDLTGHEDKLVKLHTDGTILKAAAAGDAIGVYKGRLNSEADYGRVRLLGTGGTVRMVQEAATAIAAKVMQATTDKAKVLTASGACQVIGIKLGPSGTGADGDIIEVLAIAQYKAS